MAGLTMHTILIAETLCPDRMMCIGKRNEDGGVPHF
jgi:hypothetical protein